MENEKNRRSLLPLYSPAAFHRIFIALSEREGEREREGGREISGNTGFGQ